MNIDRFRVRVWEITSEIMREGYLVFKKGELAWFHEVKSGSTFNPRAWPFVPMDCTGLRDSEDKLIWEGDVLHYLAEGVVSSDDPLPYLHIRIVKYDEKYGHLTHAYVDGNSRVSGHTFCKSNAEKYFTVIGNIYENPELIKPDE